MKDLIQALHWRYAVQKFDSEKKLTKEEIDLLLEALRLSPSSYGLQPWKFIVITNPEIRAKLREAGYGQAKITEASHLIVLAIKKNIDEGFVDEYMESVAKTRDVAVENLKSFRDMIVADIVARPVEERNEWAARQVYLALGMLLASAAILGIDAGPMEGFEPEKFDEILGLDKLDLASTVIVALGHRKFDDGAAKNAKARFPQEKVIISIY